MSATLEKYTDFIMRYRVWVLISVLLASIGASAGMSKLTMASDYRIFFGADNPD